jgi:calreticulin
MLRSSVVLVVFLIASTFSKIYFQETFETDPFSSKRWVISNWKKDTGEQGVLEWSGGLWFADARKGLRTTQDAKFYAVASKLNEIIDNQGKRLVFAFSVKHEQKIDCGGGYVKLLPPDTDPTTFSGDSKYAIMFGPDICGYSTKKVHAIFNHNGENLLKKTDVKCPDDEFTHFYTLIVNPDDTYEIRVDGESQASGNLKDDWDFEKPKMIKDPNAKKPADWVDNEYMDDPNDVKPDDWDVPATIIDPDATKPEDWNDEEDGEWEPPMIENPDYKGEWKPKQIKNPNYKGKWVHPEIPNPEYVEQKDVYKRGPLGYVGIEVWQVKSGTVFSDFIVSDSVEEVESFLQSRIVSRDEEEAAKAAYDKQNRPADEEMSEEPNFEDMEIPHVDL